MSLPTSTGERDSSAITSAASARSLGFNTDIYTKFSARGLGAQSSAGLRSSLDWCRQQVWSRKGVRRRKQVASDRLGCRLLQVPGIGPVTGVVAPHDALPPGVEIELLQPVV